MVESSQLILMKLSRHVLEVQEGGTRYHLPEGTGVFTTKVGLSLH